MEIQCECGKLRARLKAFPKGTPGRLRCYCDDCQAYLHHLKREDLLDENGGTEIIPAYPNDVEFLSGKEQLRCLQLPQRRMVRFYTGCCNTPVANVQAGRPWAGFNRRVYTVKDPNKVDQALGPVRSSVMGKFAKGTPPAGTPQKFDLKSVMTVMPFILTGNLFKKANRSPFFKDDGVTPIVTPTLL